MKIEDVKMMEDRILVRVDKQDKVGLIELSPGAQELPTSGVVLKVGPGAFDKRGRRQPMAVAIGDRVKFHPRNGNDLEFVKDEGGIELLRVLRQNDVIYIMENEDVPA